MSQPIALIDLDGTIADYDRSMREALLKLQSPSDPPLEESLRDAPPWMEERQRLIKQTPGFWKALPRIHRGFEVVAALRSLSFRLMVLSKGPVKATGAWTEKLLWCQEHLPDVGVAIISEPDAKGLVYGRVLVDDWPPFIESWLDRRPNGLVVMLDHPYNRGLKHPRVFRFIGHSPGRSADECDTEWDALMKRLKEASDRLHPPRAAE